MKTITQYVDDDGNTHGRAVDALIGDLKASLRKDLTVQSETSPQQYVMLTPGELDELVERLIAGPYLYILSNIQKEYDIINDA